MYVVFCVHAYYEAMTAVSVEEFGKKHRRDIIKPSPNDVATLCYTSVSSIHVGITHSPVEVNQ